MEKKDTKANNIAKKETYKKIVNLITSEEENKIFEKIKNVVKAFSSLNKERILELKIKNDKNKKEELINLLLSEFEKINNELNSKITFNKTQCDTIIKTLINGKDPDIFHLFNTQILGGKLGAINSVLDPIEPSILREGKGVYPLHTTAQIVTAFFCENFNNADLPILLKNLDDSIVNKIPEKIEFIKKEDFENSLKKEKYDLDDLFMFINQDIFYSNIPFQSGKDPVSNGKTYFYDRENNKISQASRESFQDCVEVSLRHMLIMILYDHNTKEYDLNNLNHIKNSFTKNLIHFLNLYTPAHANDGGEKMRSSFNTVVADVNFIKDQNHTHEMVKYNRQISNRKANELFPGFVNSIRLFERILSLQLRSFTEEKSKKQWIEKSFKKILETLNPKKKYEIKLNKFEEKNDEVYGNLKVTVFDGDTKLFSFTADHSVSHAKIVNIEDEAAKKIKKIPQIFSLATQDTAQSFWLLAPGTDNQKNITIPLYRLFSPQLKDNNSRTAFLERFIQLENSNQNQDFFTKNTDFFSACISHVLEDIGWEDEYVVKKITPLVFKLLEIKEIQSIVQEKVKGAFSADDTTLETVTKNFHNLMYLWGADDIKDPSKNISQLKNIRKIDFSQVNSYIPLHLENLPHLNDLSFAKIKNLSLKNLPLLNTLLQKNDPLIGSVELDTLPSLQKIKLSLAGVTQLIGVNTLSGLTLPVTFFN